MKIKIVSTGGTIDKIYFDGKSEYEVGDPQIVDVLKDANVTFEYDVIPLLKKDSLDMTDEDRRLIREVIRNDPARRFVVTHGTDTMIETGRMLSGLPEKVIVLTGSMQPARFKVSDAEFNIACAVMAVQLLPEGVYIAMNGRIFDPATCRKNVKANRFEELGQL
jgi:L-asparaginase